jgi:hypothetical protein
MRRRMIILRGRTARTAPTSPSTLAGSCGLRARLGSLRGRLRHPSPQRHSRIDHKTQRGEPRARRRLFGQDDRGHLRAQSFTSVMIDGGAQILKFPPRLNSATLARGNDQPARSLRSKKIHANHSEAGDGVALAVASWQQRVIAAAAGCPLLAADCRDV